MKLTPIYVIQVASTVPGGLFHRYRSDDIGTDIPVSVREEKARKIVADLEKRGEGARAYHYGWVQRGFRPGEPQCTELCRNKFWKD